MVRRNALKSIAMMAAGAGLAAQDATASAGSAKAAASESKSRGSCFIKTRDGVNLHCKDFGAGKPVVFIANWAMTSDMWQYQLAMMSGQGGVRCVAYDRRGVGKSDQPGRGYEFDTLADDLAAVLEQLDLRDVTLVGHSMGSGEIVRYLSRHGTTRVGRVFLIAPTTPFLLRTSDNPDGLDKSSFDDMRNAWFRDWPRWVEENVPPYFAVGVSPETMKWIGSMALQCPLKTAVDLSYSWSETDFRPELRKLTLPTMIIQGDRDTLPIDITGRKTAALVPGCQFKVYQGESHGIMFTSARRLQAEILDFINS